MEKPLGISGRIAAGFQRNAITPLLALVLLLAGIFATLVLLLLALLLTAEWLLRKKGGLA